MPIRSNWKKLQQYVLEEKEAFDLTGPGGLPLDEVLFFVVVPIAALLTDLKARGMLDETLVVWTTEFGRTPFNTGKESVWTHVGLNASLPIALSKTATLTPYIAYNISGAGRTETNTANSVYGADDDQLFFGFSLKAVF